MLKSMKATVVKSSAKTTSTKEGKNRKSPNRDVPYVLNHPISIKQQVEDSHVVEALLGKRSPISAKIRKGIREIAEILANVRTGIKATERNKRKIAFLHVYCFRFAAAAVSDPELHGCDEKIVSQLVTAAKGKAAKLGENVLTA